MSDIEDRFDKALAAGDGLWRHCLAEAVIAVLSRCATIGAKDLIAELQDMNARNPNDPVGRGSAAAIERLRNLVPVSQEDEPE